MYHGPLQISRLEERDNMKKGDYIRCDAESIGVDMKQLVNLLDIVIDDFEDNGALEARRELTVSALYIIKDRLDLLADMQSEAAGRMAAEAQA